MSVRCARPLATFVMLALLTQAASAAVSVWPLGDSITYGWSTTTVSTPGGYREPMYEQLTANGWDVWYYKDEHGNKVVIDTLREKLRSVNV